MNHTLTYHINTPDLPDPERAIDVAASQSDIRHLVEEGYLVREKLVTGELLETLRAAADEVAEAQGGRDSSLTSGGFGGLFVRSLMDKHKTFRDVLLQFAPTLSVARAVLGPQVQIHASVLRVTYPGQPNQETEWHFHQRVIPDPLPPLFARPRVLDNLIYLDDIDEASGPLAVVPRSHLDLKKRLGGREFGDKPGQKLLTVPAGSCVTADANLWHRACPTRPDGHKRRLLILGYSPTWMKQIDKPGGGLTDELLPDADQETRELLGLAGYY